MRTSDSSYQDVIVRIKSEWVMLTDEDVRQGLKHREGLLERLRHRHNLGLDDAHAQLHAFEKKNPELMFENS